MMDGDMAFLGPMFGMFLLTLAMGIVALVGRVLAVRRRQMRVRDFRVLDLATAPPFVARSTKHIANLFEVPMLFYVVMLIALAREIDDPVASGLGWAFVGMRGVHSFVHLTYNRVTHRLTIFWLSCLVLTILWVRVVLFS